MRKKSEQKQLRVVKKTLYDQRAKKVRDWYEVQYTTWVPFRTYSGAIRFGDKQQALEFCLRKKAGVTTNGTETEVVT